MTLMSNDIKVVFILYLDFYKLKFDLYTFPCMLVNCMESSLSVTVPNQSFFIYIEFVVCTV